MPDTTRIPVSRVVLEKSLYPRSLMDRDTVLRYSETIDRLPPILVRSGDFVLIDGAHRLEAHKLAGMPDIAVEFLDVDDRQLLRMAMRANAAHGLQLSRDDKRWWAEKLYSEAHHSELADVKRELSNDLSVPERTLRSWLKDIDDRKDAELWEQVHSLLAEGKSQQQIADELGVGRSVVRRMSEQSGDFGNMAETTSPDMGEELSVHPLNILPDMQPVEYEALKQSIEEFGFMNALPITMFEGKILDGKMRYRAARELGMAPAHIPAVPLNHHEGSEIEEVYANVNSVYMKPMNPTKWEADQDPQKVLIPGPVALLVFTSRREVDLETPYDELPDSIKDQIRSVYKAQYEKSMSEKLRPGEHRALITCRRHIWPKPDAPYCLPERHLCPHQIKALNEARLWWDDEGGVWGRGCYISLGVCGEDGLQKSWPGIPYQGEEIIKPQIFADAMRTMICDHRCFYGGSTGGS